MAVRMTKIALEELDAVPDEKRPVVLDAIKALQVTDAETDEVYSIGGTTTAHVHRIAGTDFGLVYGLRDVDGDGVPDPVVLNLHVYGRMDLPLTPTLARAVQKSYVV